MEGSRISAHPTSGLWNWHMPSWSVDLLPLATAALPSFAIAKGAVNTNATDLDRRLSLTSHGVQKHL